MAADDTNSTVKAECEMLLIQQCATPLWLHFGNRGPRNSIPIGNYELEFLKSSGLK